jgi:hypothetical protein
LIVRPGFEREFCCDIRGKPEDLTAAPGIAQGVDQGRIQAGFGRVAKQRGYIPETVPSGAWVALS